MGESVSIASTFCTLRYAVNESKSVYSVALVVFVRADRDPERPV